MANLVWANTHISGYVMHNSIGIFQTSGYVMHNSIGIFFSDFFSDSDYAPVPKFLNPGPAILQIWESDTCSDSGYNHRSNRNSPMFLPKKWPHRLLLLPKLKSDSGSGSVFSEKFDSRSGSERKTHNPSGVDSGNPGPVPPLLQRPIRLPVLPDYKKFYSQTSQKNLPKVAKIAKTYSQLWKLTKKLSH